MKPHHLFGLGLALVLAHSMVFAQNWNTNGNDIYNNNSGKVGIGISSPNDKLDVAGPMTVRGDGNNSPHGTSFTSNEEVFRIPGPTSDYIIAVQDGSGRIQHYWNSTTNSSSEGNIYLVTNEEAWMWDVSVAADPYMEFKFAPKSTDPQGESINWATHMAFMMNGNIGIGTTNPQALLDVNGTTRTKVIEITGGSDLA